MKNDEIRNQVRAGYGKVAGRSGNCCGGGESDERHAVQIGYGKEELEAIPEEANLGLGCGNPSAIAELSCGEVVLDLGSGAGMDAFLAASKVGESGHVIGVDMTSEMLGRARDASSRRGVSHFVEFRHGFIEELPVVDESVDVILSNCVINLSPDKERVFEEAYRVLKPGGRLAVSDICLSAPLPESILDIEAAYLACISGAMLAEDYEEAMKKAGFRNIEAERSDASAIIDGVCCDPVFRDSVDSISAEELEEVRERIWSYRYTAEKP